MKRDPVSKEPVLPRRTFLGVLFSGIGLAAACRAWPSAERVPPTEAAGPLTLSDNPNQNPIQHRIAEDLGTKYVYSYDPPGTARLCNPTEELGRRTTYCYDNAGRLERIRYADGSERRLYG
jgi:YD repeat-containing protein